MSSIVIFIVSLSASWLLGFGVYRLLLSRGIVDRPNSRSSHSAPTARGGGIGIMCAVLGGAVLIATHVPGSGILWIAAAALLLALISFIDDLKSVSPAVRFGCHIAAALSVLFVIDRFPLGIELSESLILPLPKVLLLIILFLWLAGYTNAFNFMDGINGIAAGQAFVTAVGIASMVGFVSGHWNSPPVLLSLVVAGSALGFLPHNFPRARMFMGDVSSAPLGFLLAALTLWCAMKYGWFLLVPLVLIQA